MQNLTIIENELVPVYTTDKGIKVVYGTELYEVLGAKSRYNDWVKNRLNDCEATENVDFTAFTKNLVKGRPSIDHIILLDTAKEMAMLERNDQGKKVRRYFIEIEKKYKSKQQEPSLTNLSPMLQYLAQLEMGQNENRREISLLKEQSEAQAAAISNVKSALLDTGAEENFSQWVRNIIGRIAASPEYEGNRIRYQTVWSESYKRLESRAGCRLDVQLRNAQKRAARDGASKSQIKHMSKLSLIEANRRLKELYIAILKEMAAAYCISA